MKSYRKIGNEKLSVQNAILDKLQNGFDNSSWCYEIKRNAVLPYNETQEDDIYTLRYKELKIITIKLKIILQNWDYKVDPRPLGFMQVLKDSESVNLLVNNLDEFLVQCLQSFCFEPQYSVKKIAEFKQITVFSYLVRNLFRKYYVIKHFSGTDYSILEILRDKFFRGICEFFMIVMRNKSIEQLNEEKIWSRMGIFLMPFFERYDKDKNNNLEPDVQVI